MNCYNHKDKAASNTCSQCGNWICDDCLVNVNGRLLCKECVENIARTSLNGHPAPLPIPPYEVVNRPHYHGSRHDMPRGRGSRDINGFFLFCLSIIPGLNYMYMGLMKKGLLFMASFFLSIYFANFNFPFMGIVTFMIMCTSFFDGFSVRRRILSGETVDDNIDDVVLFVQRNKGLLILIGAVIVGLGVLGKLRRVFMSASSRIIVYGLGWEIMQLISNLFSIAVIGLGVYLIYRAFSRKEDKDEGNK